MKLSQLPIRMKLMFAIGSPILTVMIAGLLIFSNIKSMESTTKWVSHTQQVLGTADKIVASAVDMETGMRGFLLAGKEEFLQPFNAGLKSAFDYLTQLRQTVSDNPKQVKRLDTAANTLKQWQTEIAEPMIDMRRNVGTTTTMAALTELVSQAKGKFYFDGFRSVMQDFKAEEERLMKTRKEHYQHTSSNTEYTTAFGILISIIVGLITGIYVIRELMQLLGGEPSEVRTITNQVTNGDLLVHFDHNAPPESIYGSMQTMVKQLATMVSHIKSIATDLSVAASQSSSVANDTTDSIASQLNETTQVAAAIEEMSATVKEVANNVTIAATASTEVNSQTLDSREMMNETVTRMHELNSDVENASNAVQSLEQNANQISSIIEVIKGVAEQTNLLALNAAIEAARAGEQGRGFAVVADEVRSLAERTQHSTKEINQMIDKLQSDVKDAVMVMDKSRAKASDVLAQISKSDDSLNLIQQAVQRINDMNTQISSAAEQQSVVVGEINQNVVRVQDMAEKTSQGARQTSETGSALLRLSQTLQESISLFKV